MSDDKVSLFDKIKFTIGVVLFVALVGIHVWIKDLPVWIFGLPAALWGVDIGSAFGKKK